MSPEQSAREARALAEIVQRINQSLELDRVFALIVRHAAELLHARGARLGLVENGRMVIAATHGDSGDVAITDAETFGALSATGDPSRWERRRGAPNAGNIVAVPCVANGLVIGAISVFDLPERRFARQRIADFQAFRIDELAQAADGPGNQTFTAPLEIHC